MANERNAVVTGIGLVGPGGADRESFWRNLWNGVSSTMRTTLCDPTPFRSQSAGEASFDPLAQGLTVQEAQTLDRAAQLLVVAAAEASRESGEFTVGGGSNRVGLYIGSAVGATMSMERIYRRASHDGALNEVDELIETAEHGQIRGREGSVVHVEVFRQMVSVRTSILEDLDAYPRTSRRPPTTPQLRRARILRKPATVESSGRAICMVVKESSLRSNAWPILGIYLQKASCSPRFPSRFEAQEELGLARWRSLTMIDSRTSLRLAGQFLCSHEGSLANHAQHCFDGLSCETIV